jgi:hypothetical protein
VVGRGNYHGIYPLIQLVQHSPKISEGLGLGVLLEDVACPLLIHVTQTDDVRPAAGDVFQVASSLAADTDAGHIQLAVGFVSEREPGSGQKEQSRAGKSRGSKEVATREKSLHAASLASQRLGDKKRRPSPPNALQTGFGWFKLWTDALSDDLCSVVRRCRDG